MSPSSFQPAEIVADTFVEQVEYHAELDSTNDLALSLLKSGAEFATPLLIVCDQQTAGRGRDTNIWWTQAGALTFSIVTDMEKIGLPPERRPRVSLAAAVAIAQTIEGFVSQPAAIKWPNDVYAAQRKIAGILTETVPASPHRMVVGLGLNVNNTFHSAPTEVAGQATSLYELSGESFCLQAVLVDVLSRFENALCLLRDDAEGLAAQWQSRDYLIHKTVTVSSGPQNISGTCAGIAADGGLKLVAGGTTRTVYGGSVSAMR